MFNADRVFAFRGLVLTALKVYQREVEKVIKGEKSIESDTSDTESILERIELLRGEFVDQKTLNLEGTPLGDMIGGLTLRDDDGTVLTVENLNDLLMRIGVDAPMDHIGAWTLDQRKVVNAYRKARELFVVGEAPEPALPDIISDTWLRTTDLLETPLSDEAIDEAMNEGPWKVQADANAKSPGEADWEVLKQLPDAEGTTTTSHGMFGQLDRARLIAANLNIIERGRRMITNDAPDSPAATADGEDVDADKKGDDLPANEAEAALVEGGKKRKRLQHRKAAPPSDA